MKNSLKMARLQVKKSVLQGYGVFAGQDFRPGDLIEECRVIVSDQSLPPYHDYLFAAKDKFFLCLGFGSLYNHADQPNADYTLNYDLGSLTFTAASPIRKGEEILISYGENWFAGRKRQSFKLPWRYRVYRALLPYLFLGRFALVCFALAALLQCFH